MSNGFILIHWRDRTNTVRCDFIECKGLWRKELDKFNQYVAAVGGAVLETTRCSTKEGPQHGIKER